jgi:hypothetical protein
MAAREAHILSMPHALRAALFLCLWLPAPATALTFAFSGTVETVTDTDDFLDGSVAPATVVTGTFEVDPTSANTSSPFGVGLAQLSFQLGNYLFQASQDPHAISLINDHVVAGPVTDDILQAAEILAPDLTPTSNSSGDFAGYLALIQFFDFDSTVFDGSETQPFVPGSVAAPWEQVRLTLNSVDDSGVYDERAKVQVDLTSWAVQPVPEPRSAMLLALGLASFAHQRRRARGR